MLGSTRELMSAPEKDRLTLERYFKHQFKSPLHALRSLCPCGGTHAFINDCSLTVQLAVVKEVGEMKWIVEDRKNQVEYIREIMKSQLIDETHRGMDGETMPCDCLKFYYNYKDFCMHEFIRYGTFRRFFRLQKDERCTRGVYCAICASTMDPPDFKCLVEVERHPGVLAKVQNVVYHLVADWDFQGDISRHKSFNSEVRRVVQDLRTELDNEENPQRVFDVRQMSSSGIIKAIEEFIWTLVTHINEHQSVYSYRLGEVSMKMAQEVFLERPPDHGIGGLCHAQTVASFQWNDVGTSIFSKLPEDLWFNKIFPFFHSSSAVVCALMRADRAMNHPEMYECVWRKVYMGTFSDMLDDFYSGKEQREYELFSKGPYSSTSNVTKSFSAQFPTTMMVPDWGKQYAILKVAAMMFTFDRASASSFDMIHSKWWEGVRFSIVVAPEMRAKRSFTLSDYLRHIPSYDDSRQLEWQEFPVAEFEHYAPPWRTTDNYFSELRMVLKYFGNVSYFRRGNDWYVDQSNSREIMLLALIPSGHFVVWQSTRSQ